MACGHAHSVAVDDQGRVYSWGDNQSGQLGVGSVDKQASCPYPRSAKSVLHVIWCVVCIGWCCVDCVCVCVCVLVCADC